MEDILIPIVAIFSVFVVPALVVVSIIVAVYKHRVARYKAIELAINNNASPEAIEKLVSSIGAEVGKKSVPSRQSNLTQGTILLAVGISFLIFWAYGHDRVPLYLGTLLSLLGVAKLIVAFFIIKDQQENKDTQEEQ